MNATMPATHRITVIQDYVIHQRPPILTRAALNGSGTLSIGYKTSHYFGPLRPEWQRHGYYAELNGFPIRPVWYGDDRIRQVDQPLNDLITDLEVKAYAQQTSQPFTAFLDLGNERLALTAEDVKALTEEAIQALEEYDAAHEAAAQAWRERGQPLNPLARLDVQRTVYGGGKNWIARLSGPDDRHTFARRFENARDETTHRSNTYRELHWTLRNGVYEYCFQESASRQVRGFWLVENGREQVLHQTEVLHAIERLDWLEDIAASDAARLAATPCDVSARAKPDEGGMEPDRVQEAREDFHVMVVSGTLTLHLDDGSVQQNPLNFVLGGDNVWVVDGHTTYHNGKLWRPWAYYGPQSLEQLIKKALDPQWDNLTPQGLMRHQQRPRRAVAYTLSAYSSDPAQGYTIPSEQLQAIRAVYPNLRARR